MFSVMNISIHKMMGYLKSRIFSKSQVDEEKRKRFQLEMVIDSHNGAERDYGLLNLLTPQSLYLSKILARFSRYIEFSTQSSHCFAFKQSCYKL